MQTLKILFTTFAILAGVAFLIASWYIILLLSIVVIIYLSVKSYYTVKDI